MRNSAPVIFPVVHTDLEMVLRDVHDELTKKIHPLGAVNALYACSGVRSSPDNVRPKTPQ
jgi:hypothetical protein